MTHLSIEQIHALVDRTIREDERKRFMEHVRACDRCSRQVQFEARLRDALTTTPLISPSRKFTQQVMERIAPSPVLAMVYRILGAGGKILAMALVLGILGYALSLRLDGIQNDDPSGSSGILSDLSGLSAYYREASRLISLQSVNVSREVVEAAGPDRAKLFTMIVLTFIVLGAVDRYVMRPKLKL